MNGKYFFHFPFDFNENKHSRRCPRRAEGGCSTGTGVNGPQVAIKDVAGNDHAVAVKTIEVSKR